MKNEKKYCTGMVFGVFDGLHAGHRAYLAEALTLCEKLVVVVAQDDIVLALKMRTTKTSLDERMANLAHWDKSLVIVEGDPVHGSWKVLTSHAPDIVFLGYDQESLARELDKISMPYHFLQPHFPEKFKSSLLQ